MQYTFYLLKGIKMKKSLFVAMMLASSLAFASAPTKGVDCSNKKNATKIQCKQAPKSDVEKKAVVKPPEKVRKAPDSVKKKAEANK